MTRHPVSRVRSKSFSQRLHTQSIWRSNSRIFLPSTRHLLLGAFRFGNEQRCGNALRIADLAADLLGKFVGLLDQCFEEIGDFLYSPDAFVPRGVLEGPTLIRLSKGVFKVFRKIFDYESPLPHFLAVSKPPRRR